MKSGIYTFDQIILDVIDDTGYTDLTNRFTEIKRMILRAERLINPFSSALVRKKMILYSANNNFNGTRFRKEEDFMFLDKVGCCQEGLCEGAYYESLSHVILCDGETRTSITYVYWAIRTDENGNPFTTYNHSEAVVKFIVWKLIQQKYMLGEKGLSDVQNWELNFEDEAAFARGEDFFPTEQSFNRMLLDNQTEKMVLFTEFTRVGSGEDGCVSCDCIETESEINPDDPDEVKTVIWYYQFDDLKEPKDEVNIIDDAWLEANATSYPEAELLDGEYIDQVEIGRLGFVIKTDTENVYRIKDLLGNDITETVFTRTYDSITLLEIFISKSVYSTGTLYYKFEK